MIRWSGDTEQQARLLIDAVVAGGPNGLAAWRNLMALVAPYVEAWARANRLLRRCRLVGDDDTRAVMVGFFERLAANDHANLRAFQKREAAEHDEGDELVDELSRLGRLEDDDDGPARDGDAPAKAWLVRLVDYAARDHMRRRFGWTQGDGPTKRDLHSDAMPLENAAEVGARPPMTDRLTVSKLVAEVRAYMASFPDAMQSALTLWLDDRGFDEIAAELALADAEKARALVRAGQARLREKFRGRAPLFA